MTSCGFINFDDNVYVTQNPHVQAGLTGPSVAWAFRTGEGGNWHPVTWLSHMLDVQLFGMDPGKAHRTNLLLHALNAVLLFLLFFRLTGAIWPSALVAGLFALHPLHVESVAWISERKDVLSTFFWLLTTATWVKYLNSRRFGWYVLALLFFALGLMSKPMLVTLPFVLLLLDYWPLQRIGPLSSRSAGTLIPLLREKGALFAAAGAFSILAYWTQSRGGAVQNLEAIPMGERLANAILSLVMYLGQALWPNGLAIFYPHPHTPLLSWAVAGAGLLLAGVTALVLWLARRARFLSVGWLWYVGTLVPVLGIVQIGLQARADRYTYVPLIGIFVMVAWSLSALAKVGELTRYATIAGGALSLTLLGTASAHQVAHWKNSEMLFRHAVGVTSNNSLAHAYLANALAEENRLDEAIAEYRMALALDPDAAMTHNNLGLALQANGETADALSCFEQAVRLDPASFEARANLAEALEQEGRATDALDQYRAALKLQPGSAKTLIAMGRLLGRLGQMDQALDCLRGAVSADPGDAVAHANLGVALDQAGHSAEALEELRAALRLEPDSPEIWNSLGLAHARAGELREAVESFRRALELRPDYEQARSNLERAEAMLQQQH